MLSKLQIELIGQRLKNESARVFVMDVDGQKVVIKRQQETRSSFFYTVLRLCARITREPLLMPAYVPGSAKVQEVEVARIRELSQAGVAVPELLHVSTNWIALSYVGEGNLIDIMMKSGNPIQYWERALATISDVHRKGQCLSQVFLRNIMYQNDRMVFIDFEDDPARALGLTNAQARDWVFFLFSSVWMLKEPRNELVKIVAKYLLKESPEVQSAVLHTAKSVSWLRFLPKNRKPWGRDVVAVQGYAELIHELDGVLKTQTQLSYSQ